MRSSQLHGWEHIFCELAAARNLRHLFECRLDDDCTKVLPLCWPKLQAPHHGTRRARSRFILFPFINLTPSWLDNFQLHHATTPFLPPHQSNVWLTPRVCFTRWSNWLLLHSSTTAAFCLRHSETNNQIAHTFLSPHNNAEEPGIRCRDYWTHHREYGSVSSNSARTLGHLH